MSLDGAERARALALTLLAACLPAPEGPRPAAPLTESFRCWTPLRDWEQDGAGIETLRQIFATYWTGHADAQVRPSALIVGDSAAVMEAVAPGAGRESVRVTLVLTLASSLVDEVRCYVDPRKMGPGWSAGGGAGTGGH